jgi:uncharacterized protein
LRYKIRDIPPGGLAAELPISKELFEMALEGTAADLSRCHATLRVEISKDERDVLFMRGRLLGRLGLACGRCLAPAEFSLDIPLRMTFTAEEEEADESNDPLDDVDFGHHDGETLDLEPAVRELLILTVPISPLCKESCAGLCPVCGANRNDEKERQCGHTGEFKLGDPRFEALKDLKLKS